MNTNYACLPYAADFGFCDTSLSVEDRLADLVPRVNLSDAGHQLTAREGPAIPELGLPSYYWGTNAIHGLQNLQCLVFPDGSQQCPTGFAAPNCLSAAFNDSLVEDMGASLGRELRAYFNNASWNSLDTWSPTININRDPRWGRNVESPGEDPLRNGRFGAAYSRGLQDSPLDESYKQAIVTIKHWMAYSVENFNGTTRHNFDAVVSAYDLAETYFPAWEIVVKEGGALGVMCSYNELNGIPTCGNPELTATLREDWGFEGYITSDSDAVADIYKTHKYEPNGTLAVRDALAAGCDIDSGNTYIDFVEKSVEEGSATRASVDAALSNAYRMRMITGTFDPNVSSPLFTIGTDVVGCEAHQVTSLLGARQGMTLLKNDGQFGLPFEKGLNVALIGRIASDSKSLLGNYNGPLCKDGTFDCVPSLDTQVRAVGGGNVTVFTDVSDVDGGVAAAEAADVVILVADNAADGGGESNDRTYTHLEDSQKALMDAVLAKTGVGGSAPKPTALVLVNGGIISIDDLNQTAPAILEAWEPGFHGAQAVAETLFGDNNPGGKMPVTLYDSSYIDDVDFLNMSMQAGPGRSYKYYGGEKTIYPFGFGLSFTEFTLDWSSAGVDDSAVLLSASDRQTYEVTVTNVGAVAGDEVVLAFTAAATVERLGQNVPVPLKELFDYKRVSLAPGDSTKIKFELDAAKHLAMHDADGHEHLHNGEYRVIFSRGHGHELTSTVTVAAEGAPMRLSTFRKWW